MRCIIVTNGSGFGSLEVGKPMPRGFWQSGDGATYDSKEQAQEWVWDYCELLESLAPVCERARK